MNKNWSELQTKQWEWQTTNFPNAQAHDCLLGMGEEILYEYVDDHSKDGKLDAIADAMIFMLGYCSSNNISFSNHVMLFGESQNTREYTYYFGMLCQGHLKDQQGIRKNDVNYGVVVSKALNGMYNSLRKKLNTLDPDIDIFDLTEMVFRETVEKRDWNKNSENGES
jgi:hypothetical protein